MTYEYIEEIDRVLPVIAEGDPSPTEAESQEAERLEAAVRNGDPRAQLIRSDGGVLVHWIG